MTRTELQERLEAYGPRTTRAMLIVNALLIMFSLSVLAAFLRGPLEGRTVWLSFFILNTFIVLLGIGLAIRAGRQRARRFELHCPQCDKIIAGRAGASVISTGRCPLCGLQITSD